MQTLAEQWKKRDKEREALLNKKVRKFRALISISSHLQKELPLFGHPTSERVCAA